jgi:hypothetical protein
MINSKINIIRTSFLAPTSCFKELLTLYQRMFPEHFIPYLCPLHITTFQTVPEQVFVLYEFYDTLFAGKTIQPYQLQALRFVFLNAGAIPA